jgi:hypothetical protein
MAERGMTLLQMHWESVHAISASSPPPPAKQPGQQSPPAHRLLLRLVLALRGRWRCQPRLLLLAGLDSLNIRSGARCFQCACPLLLFFHLMLVLLLGGGSCCL